LKGDILFSTLIWRLAADCYTIFLIFDVSVVVKGVTEKKTRAEWVQTQSRKQLWYETL